jgi:hypothetical protein
MRFELPNQLSATPIGAGSAMPRRPKAARRSASVTRFHISLSQHGVPGPPGSGRRMAQSTGTTKRPSPTTTSSKSPSMSDNTCVLAAPPPADQLSLCPILLEHRVIPDPGPRFSGRPRSCRACSRASMTRCAWRRSRSRRSCAWRRRRCLALAGFLAYRMLGDIACSFRPFCSQGTVRRTLCPLRH